MTDRTGPKTSLTHSSLSCCEQNQVISSGTSVQSSFTGLSRPSCKMNGWRITSYTGSGPLSVLILRKTTVHRTPVWISQKRKTDIHRDSRGFDRIEKEKEKKKREKKKSLMRRWHAMAIAANPGNIPWSSMSPSSIRDRNPYHRLSQTRVDRNDP
ncbi:hypothetical protein BO82DRAFT_159388 [Aspergillus uvarum CBS 121591]|uniref:Uncharacterized protein n=1 Tax=Aspergillus uvarum CBS 121591 TaxID=1448315 RepID=A0A319BX30_9EURO|nr:hypothetical protein BO82DRAFT_159388 [Aspergillus uvarum CBS 121591]PYH78256.1 hypothetical protein BO82DRAFT_159388 [Aspergillus uvarum CBS 121591]